MGLSVSSPGTRELKIPKSNQIQPKTKQPT